MKPLFAVFVSLVLLTACSNDDNASRRDPSSPPPTQAASALPTQLHPQGTRLGLPGVDALLQAAEDHNTAALLDQTQYFEIPCENDDDSVFPTCPPGAPEGTPVAATLHGECERDWVAKTLIGPGDFESYFIEDLGLLAVVKVAPPSRSIAEGGPPPAEYMVVLGAHRPGGNGPNLLRPGRSDSACGARLPEVRERDARGRRGERTGC